MDDFVLKRFPSQLEAAEHRAATVDENLALEQTIGNLQSTEFLTGALHPIYAKGNVHASTFALGNCREQFAQAKRLSAIQNCLAMRVGWVAVDNVTWLSFRHRL